MPLNGSGTFVPAGSSVYPAVTTTTISSTDFDALIADVVTALSTAIYKDGQSTPTANIPMGGFKFTGLGAGNASGNSLRYEQVNGVVTTAGDVLVATGAGAFTRAGIGTDGQVASVISSSLVYVDNPSRPNLLINPNWQIDQINEGALYTYSATTAVGPDGWSGKATGAGIFKLRTLADPDNAALKCLEITCTTADATIGATDTYAIYTAVEGYDAAALMTGTSSAQAITAQFKFKTSVTGVYGVAISNSAQDRRYIGIITVADTSEHEYTVQLTMDTSGTWLYTNGAGLYFSIALAGGANFQGTSGAWGAGAGIGFTTSAQCNFMSANTNTAYLKRIQLIPGNLVQAYRASDIQKELARAMRAYEKSYEQGTAVGAATVVGMAGIQSSGAVGTANESFNVRYTVPKRGSTSVSTWSATGTASQFSTFTAGTGPVADSNNGIVVSNGGSTGFFATNTTTSANAVFIHYAANARLS